MLSRLFQRYTGFLRSLKAAYTLNNLLHAPRLKRNKPLYRKYGVRKSIFAPIGSADFPAHHADIPWLDTPDAGDRLLQSANYAKLPGAWQEAAQSFVERGYAILPGFFKESDAKELGLEIDRLLAEGKAGFNYTGRKIFNLHEYSEWADKRFFRNPALLDFLSFLLGKKVIPFQTLGFQMGSEQRAHSDSIHMTTEPPGYLIATWIALEDCDPDNGPLFYFPGSHRLPYVMTPDYDSGNTRWLIGHESNKRYEDRIAALIAEHGLQPELFLPRCGDVLIWHANLLHGGSPIRREGATRRSLVCHYFAEEVICYHEISQRPAIIDLKDND